MTRLSRQPTNLITPAPTSVLSYSNSLVKLAVYLMFQYKKKKNLSAFSNMLYWVIQSTRKRKIAGSIKQDNSCDSSRCVSEIKLHAMNDSELQTKCKGNMQKVGAFSFLSKWHFSIFVLNQEDELFQTNSFINMSRMNTQV